MNGIGEPGDEDCQVMWENCIFAEREGDVTGTTCSRSMDAVANTQASKKAKKARGFRLLVASE